MKYAIVALIALFAGFGIGWIGSTAGVKLPPPDEPKIEVKAEEKAPDYAPVKITAVDNVKDFRFDKEPKNSVSAAITFDKEVPNGYGLLVVDLKSGGSIKIKMTDNHGPGFKWGGPVSKLNGTWTHKSNTEPGHLVGCTARFYSSDFLPEVLRNNIK